MHWWRSLQYQVLAATLVLGLLPLLMVGLFFREGAVGGLRAQMLATSTTDGQQAQAILGEHGQRLLILADALALAPGVIQATTAQNPEQLVTVVRTRALELNGAALTVFRRDGAAFIPLGPSSAPPSLLSGDALEAVSNSETLLRIERGGPNGLVERAYAPVVSNDSVIGAVILEQNLDAGFLQSLRTSAGLDAFAILPDGAVVNARLRPGDVARIQSAPDHFAALIPVNGVLSGVYAWQVQDGTGSSIGQLGVIDSAQAMQQAIDYLRQTALFAGAIAILGAAVAAWVLSRIIFRPLGRISAAAQAIAEGERTEITPTNRRDEIGVLSRSLASMVTTLAGNEDRLQRIIETIADGIIVLDQHGRFRLTNAATERLVGSPRSQIIGALWSASSWARESIDGGLFPDAEYPFERVQRTLTPVYDVQFVIVRPDQRRIIVSVNAAPLYDSNGGFAGAVASFTDITERKEAERRLKELYSAAEQSRAEAKAIIDAANDGMILVANDGRLIEINRRFSEIFDTDRGDLLNIRLEDLSDSTNCSWDPPGILRESVMNSFYSEGMELSQVLTKVKPYHQDLEMFTTPVRNAEGVSLGRLYAFRDVTHEREVDRMKTEFVSLVSHELRTPLTSIKGYADLLIEGEVGPLSDEQSEFVAIVKNNADRLVGLVNDLLDVSRIESGKLQLRQEAVDVRLSIEQVAALMRPQVEQKNQHLTVEIPDDLPAIKGDPDRVIQILTNLVSNAHKYTPAGGTIAIRAIGGEGQIRIEVQDSGVGMTPDELSRLFTKFYRARNPATEEVGGTGLGLAITRSLVEAQGGAIGVQSEPGVGTTFAVTLPATAGSSVLPQESVPTPVGRHILVVEDEPDIAGLIRRYLERAGYVVAVAHTAEEALRVARTERPDLMTLDVMLPDADGFTLLEWMKVDAGLADIPVLVVSMVPDSGRGRLLGVVDYLSKPVREEVLLQRVGRLLTEDKLPVVLVAESDATSRATLAGQLRAAGFMVIEAEDGRTAIERARLDHPTLALLDVRLPDVDGIEVLQALRALPETRELPVVMLTALTTDGNAPRSIVEALNAEQLLSRPCDAVEVAQAIVRGLGDAT